MDAPTQQLLEVARDIYSEEPLLSCAAPAQLARVRHCLDQGADADACAEFMEHGQKVRRSVLELVVGRPDAALLVLPKVSRPGEELPLLLARAAWVNRQVKNEDARRAYPVLAHACAERFPGLAWHALAPTPQPSFYPLVPSAMLIEERAPGFNTLLEHCQCKAGLPVGRQIEDRPDREEALRDLVSARPILFWVGNTPLLEWLKRLMRDDVDPNLRCDNPDVRLLEHMAAHVPQLCLIEEVLARGATVEPRVVADLCSRIAGDRINGEEEDIVFCLLQSGQLDLDDPAALDGGQTLRGVLGEQVPAILARYEEIEIASQTPTGTAMRPGRRF